MDSKLVQELTSSGDPSICALRVASAKDGIHYGKLKGIGDHLEALNGHLRDFSKTKRILENINDGKEDTYDVSSIHAQLKNFQDFWNSEVKDPNHQIHIVGNEVEDGVIDALKEMPAKDLKKITEQIQQVVDEIKTEASDTSNQLYMEGHLYQLLMTVFQEIVKTGCRGNERLAQAKAH